MRARKPSERKTSKPPPPSVPSSAALPSGIAIRAIFDGIAPDYDRFNAWASLGLHHRWRKALVNRIPKDARVLDIATGTGDVAFLAAEAGHSVVGLDFSERMLAKAREKDAQGKIRWVSGSADKLPFSDRSFGCITSAFALRNLRGCLEGVFKENLRVLKQGGKVLHLDFGRPTSSMSRWGHRLHLTYGVPFIGQWICGSRWPKGYLETTIENFYEPADVERKLRAAGFSDVSHTPLLWGVVQLFEGIKN